MSVPPASSVFSTAAQRDWLSPRAFVLLQRAIAAGHALREELADEVAPALRAWAASRGVTHVAFRVHPLGGEPSEYRLELSRLTGAHLVGAGTPTPAAAGDHVAGSRSGRCTWDPASPAFIRVDPPAAVLCLPSVLASSEGEALDHRLPLMRSCDALSAAAVKALRLLGDDGARRVLPTVALTRRLRLVDAHPERSRCAADRIGACLTTAERQLARAGVRVQLREQGAGHELTVLPAAAGVASDQLVVALDVLRDVAPRYGLALYERGAGPDVWSLLTDAGRNLLAPGTAPEQHLRFAFFAAAVVRAFATHRELVGGATLDLGPDLEAVLAGLARGELFAGSEEERVHGAPPLRRVAGRDPASGFTGAGFALSRLEPLDITIVNTIVADAIAAQLRVIDRWLAVGEDLEPAVRDVVADAHRRHRHAVTPRGEAPEGEAGFAAGFADAAPGFVAGFTAPAHAALLTDSATRLFAEHSVMSARELAARRAARLEEEARVAVELARMWVAPAAVRRRARLAPPREEEARRSAATIDDALKTIYAASRALDAVVAGAAAAGPARAHDLAADVPPLLEDLRAAARRLTS